MSGVSQTQTGDFYPAIYLRTNVLILGIYVLILGICPKEWENKFRFHPILKVLFFYIIK